MQTERPKPIVYGSLGIESLCNAIEERGTCDILELGPIRSRNIDFWSRYSPSIFVADLRSSLPLPRTHSDEDEYVAPDWNTILCLPEGRSYNVILAWDLFNYMEIEDVSSLVRFLCSYCSPGALLFSFIYDRKEMPAEITAYSVMDELHLAYEYNGGEMRDCPRHQPRALLHAMSNFSVIESFRLRNGMVEYVHLYEEVGLKKISGRNASLNEPRIAPVQNNSERTHSH